MLLQPPARPQCPQVGQRLVRGLGGSARCHPPMAGDYRDKPERHPGPRVVTVPLVPSNCTPALADSRA